MGSVEVASSESLHIHVLLVTGGFQVLFSVTDGDSIRLLRV